MAKEYARGFYRSKAWQRCRAGYLASVHYLCERCGAPALIVHHKQHITPSSINDAGVTLAWGNLEAVCQECHNIEHHESITACRDDVMFDADGQLVRRESE